MATLFCRCLTVVCLMAVAGCGDINGPKLLSLAKNRALWDAQRMTSYTFHQTNSCFCEFSGQPVAVRVEADTVHSVRLVSTGAVLPKTGWVTIPGLFDRAEELLTTPDLTVKLEYEPSTGHPTFIGITCPDDWLDCGGTSVIRLVPTPQA